MVAEFQTLDGPSLCGTQLYQGRFEGIVAFELENSDEPLCTSVGFAQFGEVLQLVGLDGEVVQVVSVEPAEVF